jgi:hypothetical protein
MLYRNGLIVSIAAGRPKITSHTAAGLEMLLFYRDDVRPAMLAKFQNAKKTAGDYIFVTSLGPMTALYHSTVAIFKG